MNEKVKEKIVKVCGEYLHDQSGNGKVDQQNGGGGGKVCQVVSGGVR